MGLFTRQPMQLKQNLPYRLSLSTKTKLIVGLGNPGKEHAHTRHNIGFDVLDSFAEKNNFEHWQKSTKFKGLVSENRLGDTRVILLKPQTFMNLSGEAAQNIVNFYKIILSDVAVVYDDLSIPYGQIRTRVGGQSAGHNGVKSVIQYLGAGFGRIKLGIKNKQYVSSDQSSFVLLKFSNDEQKFLPSVIKEACSILTEFSYGEILIQDTRKIDLF